MISGKHSEQENKESSIIQRLVMFFVIGFFMVCAGIIILIVAVVFSNGHTGFGVIIFIGPFPIVIGAGPQTIWMVLFVLVLAILSITVFIILHRYNKDVNT